MILTEDRVAVLLNNINMRFPVLNVPVCVCRAMTLTYRDFNYGILLVGPRSSGKTAAMEIGLSGAAQPLSSASIAGFAKAINEGIIAVSYTHLTLPTILLV